MIWFACKQCGKTHGRPDSAIGATIFCDCGSGLLVPWESTATEPPTPEIVPEMPLAFKLEPVTFDAVASKSDEPAPAPPPRPRKRARTGRRDPQYCFNHQEAFKRAACADCGEGFCERCLVSFAGTDLCGPCKNYRVRNLQRAAPLSNLAILSMVGVVLTGPLTLAMLPVGRPGFPVWSVIALVLQVGVFVLSLFAMREADRDPKSTGRVFAFTGLVSAAVVSVLILLLTIYVPRQWV